MSDFADFLSSWSTHVKIILAKFHQNRLRIVEFLLMVILAVQVSVKSCHFKSRLLYM